MDGAGVGELCAAAKLAANKLATTIRLARRIGELKQGEDIETTSNAGFCATSEKEFTCH
jgi:hypothetical protein